MKKILLVASFLLTPALLLAASEDYINIFVSDLAPKLSLWSAIIVAFAASVMVFVNARSMKGGIFGTVLNYFAVGMILILGSFVVASLNVFGSEGLAKTANNILFILGYIIMALAANKLSQLAQGK